MYTDPDQMCTLWLCVDPVRRISRVECVDPHQIWKFNLVDSLDPGQLGESDQFVDPDQNANINILT